MKSIIKNARSKQSLRVAKIESLINCKSVNKLI